MSRFFESNKMAADTQVESSPSDRRMGVSPTATPLALRQARIEAHSRAMYAELEQQSYVKMILSYEKNFDHLLRDFMGRLARNARVQYNGHLANLVMRLDYNGFFSSSD